MKMTGWNKVDHEGIPESFEDEMKDLVRSTQQNLAAWKIRTKRKRFRFQNIQGTILTLWVHKLRTPATARQVVRSWRALGIPNRNDRDLPKSK